MSRDPVYRAACAAYAAWCEPAIGQFDLLPAEDKARWRRTAKAAVDAHEAELSALVEEQIAADARGRRARS